MNTCYIDVKPEVVTQVAENMLKDKDSVLVMPVIKGIENIGPSKRKPYHLMKLELVFPEGSIIAPVALSDFGLAVVARIPRALVNSKYLEKEKSNGRKTTDPETEGTADQKEA